MFNLKRAKDRRPDLQIVVAGCLAQKDREIVRQRAPHVDVVLGTHNVHRAAELVRDARTSGPLTEIWDAPPTEGDPAFDEVTVADHVRGFLGRTLA